MVLLSTEYVAILTYMYKLQTTVTLDKSYMQNLQQLT